jgi:hypothetical protein
MNREILQAAKNLIPEIVKQSKELNSEILVLLPTANGYSLQKLQTVNCYIDQEGNAIDLNPDKVLIFGSHSLKPNDVKNLINDTEYIEFLKS